MNVIRPPDYNQQMVEQLMKQVDNTQDVQKSHKMSQATLGNDPNIQKMHQYTNVNFDQSIIDNLEKELA